MKNIYFILFFLLGFINVAYGQLSEGYEKASSYKSSSSRDDYESDERLKEIERGNDRDDRQKREREERERQDADAERERKWKQEQQEAEWKQQEEARKRVKEAARAKEERVKEAAIAKEERVKEAAIAKEERIEKMSDEMLRDDYASKESRNFMKEFKDSYKSNPYYNANTDISNTIKDMSISELNDKSDGLGTLHSQALSTINQLENALSSLKEIFEKEKKEKNEEIEILKKEILKLKKEQALKEYERILVFHQDNGGEADKLIKKYEDNEKISFTKEELKIARDNAFQKIAGISPDKLSNFNNANKDNDNDNTIEMVVDYTIDIAVEAVKIKYGGDGEKGANVANIIHYTKIEIEYRDQINETKTKISEHDNKIKKLNSDIEIQESNIHFKENKKNNLIDITNKFAASEGTGLNCMTYSDALSNAGIKILEYSTIEAKER